MFVRDAGLVSGRNLKALAAAGGRYLVGQPLRAGGAVSRQVLSRPGRYRAVAENLQVKDVTVGEGERKDGKFVVHGNDDSLSGEDMALGYKQLQRVEQAWRRLKSGLRQRPVHHRLPQRFQAHVSITVLALLLERACGASWRSIRDRLKRIQWAQLLVDERVVWQVTEPSQEAHKYLEALEIDKPTPILRMD